MKPQRRTIAKSNRKAAALSFFLFGLVALTIVVTLEFLDYQAGKYSFILSKVIPLKQKISPEERFNSELTALLGGEKIAYDFFRDRSGVIHFKIDLAEPLYLPLTRELRQLVKRSGGLQLLSEVQGMKEQVVYLYQVSFDKRLTHVILLTKRLPALARTVEPFVAPGVKARPAKTPRLAIIIDDIGYADLVADQLRDLGIPLTGAVIPDAPYARREAQRLHDYGLEEIIHLPMQPKDPANHHPRDQFILLDSSDAEILSLLRNAQAQVPYARGVNNHMGSLLTSDPQAMRRVLELVRGQGLFFVDSKTAPTTVAYTLAREMKIKTALRDVFLDDVQTYEYTGAQVRRLVELARQNGRALAIGHPFPSTLAALRDSLPWLKQQKVEIVFVSQLLE
jgi:polysaccharide deacetylase 2 family uncharacterized protein YibQ